MDDHDNPSSADEPPEERSPPPKLRREEEERIPILKLEKLKDDLSNVPVELPVSSSSSVSVASSSSPTVADSSEAMSETRATTDFTSTSPPPLESFGDPANEDENSSVTDDEKDTEHHADVSLSNASDSEYEGAEGRESQSRQDEDDWKSTMSTSDKPSYSASESDRTVGDASEKSPVKEKKRKSYDTAPRKIIQSIFAKPKVHKPRKGRRGKKGKAVATKKSKTRAPKPPSKIYMNIKFPPTLSQRLSRMNTSPVPIMEDDDDDDEESQESLSQDKEDENDVEVEDIFSHRRRRHLSGKRKLSEDDDDDDDEEDFDDSSQVENTKRDEEDDNEDDNFSEVEIKEEPEEFEDKTSEEGLSQSQEIKDEVDDSSRKSDDDDIDEEDMYDQCNEEGSWKPVRAAMVAAMELVAKKQVTDDMRTERRVRKPYVKPPIPKGRGRRTMIFKRGSKPTRSYLPAEIPRTATCAYEPGKAFFQQGDIVCLVHDLRPDNPYAVRFFQLRGILLSSKMGDCGSVVYLKTRPGCEDDTVESFDPVNYYPDIYYSKERMILLEELHPIMHCPLDYYHGHDLHFQKPRPGYVYMRKGEELVEWLSTDTPPTIKTESQEQMDETSENHEGISIKEEPMQDDSESGDVNNTSSNSERSENALSS